MVSFIPDNIVPDQLRSLLKLPDVGQIGYVVEDINKAIREWQAIHQRVPWVVLDLNHPRTLHGKQGRCTLRIALSYLGRIQIELIQVLDGETIHVGATGKPEGKIHHLGFMVRNLDGRLEYCQQQGAQLIQRGTIKSAGLTVDYAYLDTSAVGSPDLILELIQWRIGPLPISANRRLFNTLRTLGSWSVFRGKIVK